MIGIAARNGQPFAVKGWINRDNELFGDKADNINAQLVTPLPIVPDGLHFEDVPYHWEFREYNIPQGNYNIHSHLQDTRYFEDYLPLVRHWLTFKDEPADNEAIALHYRAGDYQKEATSYHPRCSPEYYREAINKFPRGSTFLVFSDDEIEAIHLLRPLFRAGDKVHMICGNYLDDFKLMKHCRHFITANSSFSLMAAVLASQEGKIVISPKRWFGEAAGGMVFYGYVKNSIVI